MKKWILSILITISINCQGQKNPRLLIAYYSGPVDSLNNYNFIKVTHIIYCFLHLRGDTLSTGSPQQEEELRKLRIIKEKYPNLKILVSLGGWGGCYTCSSIFSSVASRHTFALTTAQLLTKYDLDGIDLDWEYPAIEGYPGHPYQSMDKDNFTLLVKELRHILGSQKSISFAAGSFTHYVENAIDWQAIMPYVDFVNLMTYDLVSGYSKVTGHHSLLYDYRENQQSVSKCVNWLLENKVPPSKLIIGAAFYARVWKDVAPTANGLYQAGAFTAGIPYRHYDSYFSRKEGFKKYWDKKGKATYFYNKTKQLFGTGDTKRSIKYKCRYVKRKKLGGIMFWQLGDDKKRDGLLRVIQKKWKIFFT